MSSCGEEKSEKLTPSDKRVIANKHAVPENIKESSKISHNNDVDCLTKRTERLVTDTTINLKLNTSEIEQFDHRTVHKSRYSSPETQDHGFQKGVEAQIRWSTQRETRENTIASEYTSVDENPSKSDKHDNSTISNIHRNIDVQRSSDRFMDHQAMVQNIFDNLKKDSKLQLERDSNKNFSNDSESLSKTSQKDRETKKIHNRECQEYPNDSNGPNDTIEGDGSSKSIIGAKRTMGTRRSRRNTREENAEKKAAKQLFTPRIKNQLKSWLVRRRNNPYPSRLEKRDLAQQLGLTYIQISNWFANWRRKLKKPSNGGRSCSWTQFIQTYCASDSNKSTSTSDACADRSSSCSEDRDWDEADQKLPSGRSSQGNQNIFDDSYNSLYHRQNREDHHRKSYLEMKYHEQELFYQDQHHRESKHNTTHLKQGDNMYPYQEEQKLPSYQYEYHNVNQHQRNNLMHYQSNDFCSHCPESRNFHIHQNHNLSSGGQMINHEYASFDQHFHPSQPAMQHDHYYSNMIHEDCSTFYDEEKMYAGWNLMDNHFSMQQTKWMDKNQFTEKINHSQHQDLNQIYKDQEQNALSYNDSNLKVFKSTYNDISAKTFSEGHSPKPQSACSSRQWLSKPSYSYLASFKLSNAPKIHEQYSSLETFGNPLVKGLSKPETIPTKNKGNQSQVISGIKPDSTRDNSNKMKSDILRPAKSRDTLKKWMKSVAKFEPRQSSISDDKATSWSGDRLLCYCCPKDRQHSESPGISPDVKDGFSGTEEDAIYRGLSVLQQAEIDAAKTLTFMSKITTRAS